MLKPVGRAIKSETCSSVELLRLSVKTISKGSVFPLVFLPHFLRKASSRYWSSYFPGFQTQCELFFSRSQRYSSARRAML